MPISDAFRCENCLYAVNVKVTESRQMMEFGNLACCRFPPQPVQISENEFRAFLLPTNHNWWCGEWKAKQ